MILWHRTSLLYSQIIVRGWMSSKPKKLHTKADTLADAYHAALDDVAAAKKKLAEAKGKGINTGALEQTYKDAITHADTAKKMAQMAAAAQKKVKEEEEAAEANKFYDTLAKINEKEATKPKRSEEVYVETPVQRALAESFARKEAEREREAANRRAKATAIKEANKTRKLRLNNIASKTNIKRSNVVTLVKNINALDINLKSNEIAHIITIAAKAKVEIGDVLVLIDSSLKYGTDTNAIAFLQFVKDLKLELETFIPHLERKKLPFDTLLEMLEEVPERTPRLDAEQVVYVLNLAYKAQVPVDVALELFDTELRNNESFTSEKQRIHFMRLSYITGTSIYNLLHLTNSPENRAIIDNAMKHLKNDHTFAQFAQTKKQELKKLNERPALFNLTRKLTNMLNNSSNNNNSANKKSHTKTQTKKKGESYAAVAARKKEEVKDTYTTIKVSIPPIGGVSRDLETKQQIADNIKGYFGSLYVGKDRKDMPKPNKVFIPSIGADNAPYAILTFKDHDEAHALFKKYQETSELPEFIIPKLGIKHPMKKGDIEVGTGKEREKTND